MRFQNDQCPPDYPPGRVWCSGPGIGIGLTSWRVLRTRSQPSAAATPPGPKAAPNPVAAAAGCD